jgi:hypothetical protein
MTMCSRRNIRIIIRDSGNDRRADLADNFLLRIRTSRVTDCAANHS